MSDFKYLVTVIIPVYNTQDYIEECVLSIENQKMDVSKIEVLLINDGSKDQSGNICENLSKKYANILEFQIHEILVFKEHVENI